MSESPVSHSGPGALGVGWRDLLLSASTAAAAGLVLWQAWWWAGYPLGTFKPGLAFRRTGLDPGRFLPTFIAPGAEWEWPALGLLVLTLLAGYALAREPGRDPPAGTELTGGAVAVFCVTALLGLAWIHPTGIYPAVLGSGRGGAEFWGMLTVSTGGDPETRERLVWASQRNGVLELAPRLRPDRYGIIVRAGAQATDSGPTLAIQAGAESPQRVSLESAMSPVWREREYAIEVSWPGRLELGEVSRENLVRLAYVDAVEIRRLPP